jgi:hypothetical protein
MLQKRHTAERIIRCALARNPVTPTLARQHAALGTPLAVGTMTSRIDGVPPEDAPPLHRWGNSPSA